MLCPRPGLEVPDILPDVGDLSDPNRSDFESQIASDFNRNA